jgi:elongation factor P hydroxylase
MKEIECVINTDGTVEIDMIGFKGKGCEKILDQLTKALGQKVESKTKQEYYQQEAEVKQKVRGF